MHGVSNASALSKITVGHVEQVLVAVRKRVIEKHGLKDFSEASSRVDVASKKLGRASSGTFRTADVVGLAYQAQQIAVLGAVAESQGRRGLSASAYRWIDREVAPEFRGILYRRVADGILPAVERNQSAKLGYGTGL